MNKRIRAEVFGENRKYCAVREEKPENILPENTMDHPFFFFFFGRYFWHRYGTILILGKSGFL